jgi:putative transposase
VSHCTHDGRSVRLLSLIDEYTRRSLAILPRQRWSSARVIEVVADAMLEHGRPVHIRSDNGPEFAAKSPRQWLDTTGTKTLYIEPGSPRENGYGESFNSKIRDQFLNGEIFHSMKELLLLAERWRGHYNTVRPHTPRWDINLQHPRNGWQTTRGMEEWKPLRAFHSSTPATAAT